jgi:hypothetical protein
MPFARWWAARGVAAVATAADAGGNAGSPREINEVAAVAGVAARDAPGRAAMGTPDSNLDEDWEEFAERHGETAVPQSEVDHRAVVAGFLAAGLQRPPAWSDPASVPPPGAWCGCCRIQKNGGRWWTEVASPKGWRCWVCHPPAHLRPGEVAEQRT